MKKILAFQLMIAISALATSPLHFAQAQLVLPDEVIPGQEVKPEDRGKEEPAEAQENGNSAKGRGKAEPAEAPENEKAAKGRGKREPGKSGKSRDQKTDPAAPETQNPPVPVGRVERIPMTPQVQTPPVTKTPGVPQTAPNPQTGGKGVVRNNPLQPRVPGNRPPNISKGGSKASPRQPAPDPVQKLPPADPTLEKEITRTTEKVEKEVNQKKTSIKTEGDALDIIRKVIGGNSEISRTENQRDLRIEPDRLRDGRSENKDPSRDASVSYLLKRFQGKATLSEAPPAMRQAPRPPPTRPDDRRFSDRNQRPGQDYDHDPSYLERQHPVYNGQRHVRYKSRAEIPAILLAVSALNRIQIRNYNELSYLPPTGFEVAPEYRDQNAPVVSYQVDPNSMVSREDILFLQGSTSFADRNSFATIRDLAVAMGDPSLARERFVVEGHASAEGGYDSNLALSQRRAERIVRDIVRFGVSEDRLVPVGYGESEAAYTASDPDQYRRLDRKVVIFRMSR